MKHLTRYLALTVFVWCIFSNSFVFAGLDEKLTAAIKKGDIGAVQDLLAKGADVNAKDRSGNRPLHRAVLDDQLNIVKVLLEKGADVNAIAEGLPPYTPLIFAASHNQIEMAKILLSNNADINAKSGTEFVTTKLGEVSPVTKSVRGGQTALIMAARHGYIDMVKLLLEKGADINAKTIDGSTALVLSTKNGYEETAELLKKAGAKE